MQIKKVFEFNCQCFVYKNNIKIQVKGEKGLLRKVVVNLIEKYSPQQAPPQAIKLKQPTLEQLFCRQKPQINKEPAVPLSVDSSLSVFCNDEEMHNFKLDDLTRTVSDQIKNGKINLSFNERMLFISECSSDTLHAFLNQIQKLIKYKADFQNRRVKQPEAELLQPSYVENNSQNVPEPKQLTDMQKLKLQRLRMAATTITKEKEQPQIQKQIKRDMPDPKLLTQVVPGSILLMILKNLKLGDIIQWRLVSKEFQGLINRQFVKLSFNQFNEVPFDVVSRTTSKFNNLKYLYFGLLRNVKYSQFIEWNPPKLLQLQTLDIGEIQLLNDKLGSKLILQYDTLQKLIIPYNSKITSVLINQIIMRLPKLSYLKFSFRDKQQLNEGISCQTLVNVLTQRQLIYYKIPAIQVEFFQEYFNRIQINQNTSYINKFKVGIIIINQITGNEPALLSTFINHLKCLGKLTIQSIQSVKQQHLKFTTLFTQQTFESLSNISSISFGNFVDDQFCNEIAKYLPNLSSIKIRSKLVTDEGIKSIINKCKSLNTINLAYCSSVNGHCFEYLSDMSLTLLFPKIQIIVTFDDYNIQCLESLLQQKAYEYTLKNIKIKQK